MPLFAGLTCAYFFESLPTVGSRSSRWCLFCVIAAVGSAGALQELFDGSRELTSVGPQLMDALARDVLEYSLSTRQQ